MNEIETFVAADRALVDVVGQIPDDRWEEAVPPDLPTFDGGAYTLRQILLTGRTPREVG